jgi:hypothetical protein
MATIHQEKNWRGKSVTLFPDRGLYDYTFLDNNGFINSNKNSIISSYNANGYIIKIYKSKNGTGEYEIRTDRNREMIGSYNNNIRSIRILNPLVSNEHFLLDTDNNNYLLLLLLIICIFFICRNKF